MSAKKIYQLGSKFAFLFSIIGLLALQGCKEIVATDISDTVPVLILPQQNDTLQNNPVHFKWEEVEGATKYHLQIVSKSFQNIEEYVVDSLVESTSIFISLDSNEYELMLTAMNAGYTSHTLGPIKFWVGVSAVTNSSSVTLQKPANNAYFNETFVDSSFSWSVLTNASSYEFSIRKGTSYASPNIIETTAGIVTNQYQLSNTLDEGEYHWGVKAYFSNGSETGVSTRRFYIDTVNPTIPALVSPTGSNPQGDIVFSWSSAADPGSVHSPLESYIEVSQDAAFTQLISSGYVPGSSATVNITQAGAYYYRVKQVDSAGNESSFSTTGQFSVF